MNNSYHEQNEKDLMQGFKNALYFVLTFVLLVLFIVVKSEINRLM